MRTSRVTTILASAVCASLLALAFVGRRRRRWSNLRLYEGVFPASSFNGEGSVGPGPTPWVSVHQIDINQAANNMIVGNEGYWYKISLTGTPLAFSAISPTTELGPVSQSYCCGDVAVDNSGGAGGVGEGEQGRIYSMSEGESRVVAWKANGEPVSGGFAPPNGVLVSGPCGMAVDSEGDVWVGQLCEPRTDRVQPGRDPDRQHGRHRQVRLLAGDRRQRKLLHKSSTAAKAVATNSARPAPNSSNSNRRATNPGTSRSTTARSYLHGALRPRQRVRRKMATSSRNSAVKKEAIPDFPSPVRASPSTKTPTPSTSGTTPAMSTHSSRTGEITIPDVTTDGVTVTPTTATVKGEVESGRRERRHTGRRTVNSNTAPNRTTCPRACRAKARPPFNGQVQATISSGLTTGTTYYYRITAANEAHPGVPSQGPDPELPAGRPAADIRRSRLRSQHRRRHDLGQDLARAAV